MVAKMSSSTNFMQSKTALNFEDPSTFHDRVLIVGEKKFYVVSGVLSLWSEYFRGLFNGNFNEADKKEIELKELDAHNFEIFLRSIYQHISPILKVADIIPLIELSHRFLAPVVLEQCKEYIKKKFDKIDDIKLELLQTSCIYGDDDLMAKLVDYFGDSMVLSKFSLLKILEISSEHELVDLKKRAGCFMESNFSCENCCEYLDFCLKFDLPDVKDNISDVVIDWNLGSIPHNLIIELTKSAFKHDVLNLKSKLRNLIFFCSEQVSSSKWGIIKKK